MAQHVKEEGGFAGKDLFHVAEKTRWQSLADFSGLTATGWAPHIPGLAWQQELGANSSTCFQTSAFKEAWEMGDWCVDSPLLSLPLCPECTALLRHNWHGQWA